MQFTWVGFLQVAAVGFLAWSIFRLRSSTAKVEEVRKQAWILFKQSRIDALAEEDMFDGATARVLKVEETGGTANLLTGCIDNYSLAVFAANQSGRVFHFRFSGTRTFLMPVDPTFDSALQRQSVGRTANGA
jgi:hypothetical protein